MYKLNIVHVVTLILVLHTANAVRVFDFQILKNTYNSAFVAMKRIAGNSDPVNTAKEVYDACAQAAQDYGALIECAQNAFDAFLPYMNTDAKLTEWYMGILSLNADFLRAVLSYNLGVPEEQQAIPIEGFSGWVTLAANKRRDILEAQYAALGGDDDDDNFDD